MCVRCRWLTSRPPGARPSKSVCAPSSFPESVRLSQGGGHFSSGRGWMDPVVDRHHHAQEAEADTEQADPGPAAGAIDDARRDRANRTADEVAEHVGAVDPAAGIGPKAVDDGLVGDLHALGADV